MYLATGTSALHPEPAYFPVLGPDGSAHRRDTANGHFCVKSCPVPPIKFWQSVLRLARSYKQERTAVTQALEVAAIERVGSELDSEPDLTICWVCFILPKPMNMSTVK